MTFLILMVPNKSILEAEKKKWKTFFFDPSLITMAANPAFSAIMAFNNGIT